MTIRRKISLFLLFVLVSVPVWSQDLDKMLEDATGSSTQYTTATFKSTRIINGHSIERMPGGQLDVRISHRFGPVNSGAYNLWGLDQANMHLGFEYGITDWMMAGLGRGTYEKAYDGFLKFSLFPPVKGGEKHAGLHIPVYQRGLCYSKTESSGRCQSLGQNELCCPTCWLPGNSMKDFLLKSIQHTFTGIW